MKTKTKTRPTAPRKALKPSKQKRVKCIAYEVGHRSCPCADCRASTGRIPRHNG